MQDLATLYFVDEQDQTVWTYSLIGDARWQFSRLSPCQKAKNAFTLAFLSGGAKGQQAEGWVVQDLSPGAKSEIIGRPWPKEAYPVERQDPNRPLLGGGWRIYGGRYTLRGRPPEKVPGAVGELPLTLKAPFCTMLYSEDGNVGRLEAVMHGSPITDESIEDLIGQLKPVFRNLAQRPEMVLMMRSDVRQASVPAWRHIRRFLAFIEEMGPELVLVGRGSAIIVGCTGLFGSAWVAIIRMVQRMLPSPWPETIVQSLEAADTYLAGLTTALPVLPPLAPPLTAPSLASAPFANSSPAASGIDVELARRLLPDSKADDAVAADDVLLTNLPGGSGSSTAATAAAAAAAAATPAAAAAAPAPATAAAAAAAEEGVRQEDFIDGSHIEASSPSLAAPWRCGCSCLRPVARPAPSSAPSAEPVGRSTGSRPLAAD